MIKWYAIEILVNFIQIFIIYKFYDLQYNRTFKFKYSVETVIVFMTLLLSILNFSVKINANPLIYVGFYFLMFLVATIIFKGKILSKMVVLFLLIAAMGIFEMLAAALVTFIGGFDINIIQEQNNVRLEVMIISQTLFMYFYLFMKKRYNKEKINYLNNKYYILVGFILFFNVIVMVILAWMYGNIDVNEDNVSVSLLALTICVSFLSIVSLFLMEHIIKDMEEKHKSVMELQNIKLEKAYLNDVNSALEEIRIIRHDMRGELALIHGYNELNQKDRIRSHIEKKLQEMDVQLTPQIDNENIITSFLNFKLKEAKAKNITVEVKSNINDEEIFIDKGDICRVINNIMNNAIEALQECDIKKINLFIGISGDYLLIKSENPYKGIVLTEGKKIITSKKDKTKHGYGLKSINNIAEKYQGFMSIIYDDNKFKIDVEMSNGRMHKYAINSEKNKNYNA